MVDCGACPIEYGGTKTASIASSGTHVDIGRPQAVPLVLPAWVEMTAVGQRRKVRSLRSLPLMGPKAATSRRSPKLPHSKTAAFQTCRTPNLPHSKAKDPFP